MTLIFGHRGARAYAPMNTMPAFELAQAQGADGLELDVWPSSDGIPVILHDEHVDATTNGHGSIREMPMAQIKMLDAGSWFAPEFARTPIPTLEEVFEYFADSLLINVEIKAADDADFEHSDGIEQATADLILRYGLTHRIIVSSFSLAVLKRFHAILPQVELGFLYMTYDALSDPFIKNCRYLHPYHQLVTPEYVTEHARWPLNVWTVNDPERAAELAAMGVHAIITDAPDVIRAALV